MVVRSVARSVVSGDHHLIAGAELVNHFTEAGLCFFYGERRHDGFLLLKSSTPGDSLPAFRLWRDFLRHGVLRPLGLPLRHFVRLVRGGVKLDEPVEGLVEADLGLPRNRGLALFHPLVAGNQQRLGLGVFLPARERAAEL